MTTRIDFETAKLLKEKSISIPSNRGLGVAVYEDDKIKSTCLYDGTSIHAPTIAEVVMWLYEKHQAWIEVYYDNSKKEFYTVLNGEEYKFKTPTEAYQAAITYCLTKLI